MKLNTLKFNPKDYDYLWTDHDINFIFVSCYLFKEFRKADIILIYDWRNKGLKFFLSKKDRKNFSNYGVTFYKKYFPKWKKGVMKNIRQGKKLIKMTEDDKNKISSMSNGEIKSKILERVKLFQSLGGNYFYTEFFFLDKVGKLIMEFSPKYKKVVKNFREMGKLKLKAREVLNNFYNYRRIFEPYIKEVSKRTKRKDIQWLSYQEVINLLDGKKVNISSRSRINWILTRTNSWKLIGGKRVKEIMLRFDNYFFSRRKNIINGVTANKGVYQGRAKIIKTVFSDKIAEEIKKVKQGDVLVAETTGPEMMVACRRAGAIIADEGGLLSHAAIVSRELNIPCVIGTKNATQILKDGDLIEVDAGKGVVKKV